MRTMHTVRTRGKIRAARPMTIALPVVASCFLYCVFCAAARPCTAQLLSSCDPRASASFDAWFDSTGGGNSDSARNDPLYYILGFASLLSFVHFDQLGGMPAQTRVPVSPGLPGMGNEELGGNVSSGGNGGTGTSGDTPIVLPGSPQPADPGTSASSGTDGSQPNGSGSGPTGANGDGGTVVNGGNGGNGGNAGSDGSGSPGDGTGGVSPGWPSGTGVGDNPWNGAPPGSPSGPSGQGDPSGPGAQDVTPEPGPAVFGLVLAGVSAAGLTARRRCTR